MQLVIEDKDGNSIWQSPIVSCGHEARGTDQPDYRYVATAFCYDHLAKLVPECKKGRLVIESSAVRGQGGLSASLELAHYRVDGNARGVQVSIRSCCLRIGRN